MAYIYLVENILRYRQSSEENPEINAFMDSYNERFTINENVIEHK